MSINKIQLLADAKHVQLLLEAPAQRVWVKADALRIEQVLDNLLSNALKFSPEGGIVKVLMKPDHESGSPRSERDRVGPGIPGRRPALYFRALLSRKHKGQTCHTGERPRVGAGKKSGRSTRRTDLDRKRNQEGNDCTVYPTPDETRRNSMKAATRFTSGVCCCLSPDGGLRRMVVAPPFSQPYFLVETGEAKSPPCVGEKTGGARCQKCAEHNSCDHVYFTRALIGLYESRDIASKILRKSDRRGSKEPTRLLQSSSGSS